MRKTAALVLAVFSVPLLAPIPMSNSARRHGRTEAAMPPTPAERTQQRRAAMWQAVEPYWPIPAAGMVGVAVWVARRKRSKQ